MDILADVLSVARLGRAVLSRAELVAPWGLRVDPMAQVAVHVVQRGACWLRLHGECAPRRLDEGDVVLISRHVGHSISDSPSTASAPIKDVLRDMAERLRVLGDHSEVETTILLCAKYLFEHEGSHPLVSLLPPLLHLRSADVERQPQLQLSIQLLRLESAVTADGSELVVPRILDSLLVFLLRASMKDNPPGKAAGSARSATLAFTARSASFTRGLTRNGPWRASLRVRGSHGPPLRAASCASLEKRLAPIDAVAHVPCGEAAAGARWRPRRDRHRRGVFLGASVLQSVPAAVWLLARTVSEREGRDRRN